MKNENFLSDFEIEKYKKRKSFTKVNDELNELILLLESLSLQKVY